MQNTEPVHPVARLRQPEGGQVLLFPGRSIKLGRSSDNDIVIKDPKVSRLHALIEWNGSGFAIRDLGSINGTHVNDERVSRGAGRTLRDGDQILINKRLLIFEIVRVESSEPVTEPNTIPTARVFRRGPRLVVRQGPDLGCEYPLWGERITIGRASREPGSEIRLTDNAVEHQHVCIELRDEGYTLVNLDIPVTTLLNDHLLLEPTRLETGDQIQIGETCLVFYHHKEDDVV